MYYSTNSVMIIRPCSRHLACQRSGTSSFLRCEHTVASMCTRHIREVGEKIEKWMEKPAEKRGGGRALAPLGDATFLADNCTSWKPSSCLRHKNRGRWDVYAYFRERQRPMCNQGGVPGAGFEWPAFKPLYQIG